MSVIDDYLEKLDSTQRAALEHVRELVKQTIPEAQECISYGMPGFKLNKKYVCGFAAFKDHLSFFPTSHPVEMLHDKLGSFETSKGTLQFTAGNPIPDELIKALLTVRVEQIRGKQAQ